MDAVERAGLLTVEGPRLRFRQPLLRSAVSTPPASPSAARRTRRWPPCSTTRATPTGARGTCRRRHGAGQRRQPRRWSGRLTTLPAAGGHTAAARALERAAGSTPPAAASGHLVAAAGSSALAGRVGHAVALLDRAEPDLRDPMARGMAMRVRGMASMAIGRPADAYAMLADAARTVLPVDRPAGLGLLMRACMAAAVGGDPGAIHSMLAELDTEPRSAAELFPSRLMNGISRLIAGDAARAPRRSRRRSPSPTTSRWSSRCSRPAAARSSSETGPGPGATSIA